MTTKKLFYGLFLSLISFSICFANVQDPVIAIVNGKSLKKSLFDQTYKQNMLFVSDKVVTKKKVLFDLINRELGIQKARKNKLEKDPVVLQKIEDILYHAQVSMDLEGEFKKITITKEKVKKYYRNNKEYRTAHILFRTKAIPHKAEDEEALKQALRVYNMIKSGPEKFHELANKYSQSSAAPNGGDMGYQPAARLAPEYFKAIKGKSAGHITAPVKTQFGHHIIKIMGVKDFKNINMPLYKKIVYDIERDKIIQKYYKDLRKNAKIKILDKSLQ